MTPPRAESPGSALWPLAAGVVGAGVAEGAVSSWAAASDGGGLWSVIVAGLLAFSLVGFFGALTAIPLGFLADRRFARRLAASLRLGIGGAEDATATVTFLLLGVIAAPMAASLLLGERLIAGLSPKFAAAGLALVNVAVLVLMLIGAALVGPLLVAARDRWASRLPGRLRLPATALLSASAGLALGGVLAWRLSGPHGALPAAALVGLALALLRPMRALRAVAVLAVLLALGGSAFFLAERAAPVAQSAILYRAPYLSVLIGGVHQLVDRDGDAHSPLLMGGDCDDAKKNINSDAQDVAGNGIDENCSGSDAKPYKAVTAPKVPRPAELPPKNNLLVILVDALRPDHLSFTGYARPTSPRLDQFRATATWFQNAYTSAPNTRLAVGALLTGVYAHRLPISEGKGVTTLGDGAKTLAERLAPLGYLRMAYTITYVMNRFRGYDQGFEKWDAPWGKKDWSWEWERAAPLTTDAAIKYLEGVPQDHSKPYLLFLHYRCTHDPYYKHEIDFGDENVDKYDSALNHCDTHLGRLLDSVDARADAGQTSIFLLSDHGELFGEHGHIYHGETLSEPDARIAFVARVPGQKASTVTRPVSLVDVTPTLLELAGATVPPGLDGWSLVPELFAPDGAPPRPERPLFMRTDLVRGNVHYNAAAVLAYPYKLTRDLRTRRTELFDVVSDPGEVDNLAADGPGRERAAAMAESLESWLGAGAAK